MKISNQFCPGCQIPSEKNIQDALDKCPNEDCLKEVTLFETPDKLLFEDKIGAMYHLSQTKSHRENCAFKSKVIDYLAEHTHLSINSTNEIAELLLRHGIDFMLLIIDNERFLDQLENDGIDINKLKEILKGEINEE